MRKLVIPAEPEYLDQILHFLDEQLEQVHCAQTIRTTIFIAVEEIFVNIYSYAYPPKEGDVQVYTQISGNPAVIQIDLVDQGPPYDPLQRDDPDITLGADDRPIGGLGIFMVKQTMDQVLYRYENESNILSLYKTVGGSV